MPPGATQGTLTELLRQGLKDAPSLYAIARAAGLEQASLIRFRDARLLLRLVKADEPAACFGIACRRVRRRKGT